jgi:hypothetical protein
LAIAARSYGSAEGVAKANLGLRHGLHMDDASGFDLDEIQGHVDRLTTVEVFAALIQNSRLPEHYKDSVLQRVIAKEFPAEVEAPRPLTKEDIEHLFKKVVGEELGPLAGKFNRNLREMQRQQKAAEPQPAKKKTERPRARYAAGVRKAAPKDPGDPANE